MWPDRLAEPAWLVLVPLSVLPWLGRRAVPWAGVGVGGVGRFRLSGWFRGNLPSLLRSLAIFLALLALARPQHALDSQIRRSRGVAIVLVLDRSASMSRPRPGSTSETPLQVAARALDDFVSRRPNDLIGLVAFANWPDTLCPPTLDHALLRETIRSVIPATRAEDGTNLGDALAWATQTALETPAQRRVLVLITDGRHEPDRSSVPDPLEPVDAARLARELGLIVHALGIRSPGADLDESLLAAIAAAGGGQTLIASSPADLDSVLRALEELDSSDLTAAVSARYREDWPVALAAALLALVLSLLADRFGALP